MYIYHSVKQLVPKLLLVLLSRLNLSTFSFKVDGYKCLLRLYSEILHPSWEETLIFNEQLMLFTANENIIIFFELLDFSTSATRAINAHSHGGSVASKDQTPWFYIAWGFMRPAGKVCKAQIGQRCRVQLYKFPKKRFRSFTESREVANIAVLICCIVSCVYFLFACMYSTDSKLYYSVRFIYINYSDLMLYFNTIYSFHWTLDCVYVMATHYFSHCIFIHTRCIVYGQNTTVISTQAPYMSLSKICLSRPLNLMETILVHLPYVVDQ